jgi:hypothetical protein
MNLWARRLKREADHSSAFSAKNRNARSYTSSANTSPWRDVELSTKLLGSSIHLGHSLHVWAYNADLSRPSTCWLGRCAWLLVHPAYRNARVLKQTPRLHFKVRHMFSGHTVQNIKLFYTHETSPIKNSNNLQLKSNPQENMITSDKQLTKREYYDSIFVRRNECEGLQPSSKHKELLKNWHEIYRKYAEDSRAGIAQSVLRRLRPGRPGFCSRKGQDNFLFSTASRPALGLTQPPIHGYRGLFLRGKET